MMNRRTLPRLLEPQSITFGFTVFYFLWTAAAWLREPLDSYHPYGTPDYHFNIFMAAMLLVAGAGLVCRRVWSKLIAVVLCAQVPLAFCLLFWLVAKEAEAPPFSPAHLGRWFHELAIMPVEAWLWLVVSGIIVGYATPALVRAKPSHKLAQMPTDGMQLLPHTHPAQAQLGQFTTHATNAGLHARHRVGAR